MSEYPYQCKCESFKVTILILLCRNLFVTPMYDIDLVWHTHQLNPKAYHADMTTMLGYVMTHDDSDQDRKTGSKLNNVSNAVIIYNVGK